MPITALAIRGDGAQLAIAGEENTIRVIDAGTGKMIKELKGHTGRVHAVMFSPHDGKFLVSASADATAKRWDINQGIAAANSRDTAVRSSRTARAAMDEDRYWLSRQDGPHLESDQGQNRRDPGRKLRGNSAVSISMMGPAS